MKGSNMYRLSVKQWNPFVGCRHGCVYCRPSFQAQLRRWAKNRCELCSRFEPHIHPERLDQKLPRTGYMQFIFTCACGDVAFCPTSYLKKIAERIRSMPDRTFLIQSKSPAAFRRVEWPRNVILGVTIETDRDDLAGRVSGAPPPSERFREFLAVDHEPKMVTHEPVIEFNLEVLLEWDEEISPALIWIGYDSKRCGLEEPRPEKVKRLLWRLARIGYPVILKNIIRN